MTFASRAIRASVGTLRPFEALIRWRCARQLSVFYHELFKCRYFQYFENSPFVVTATHFCSNLHHPPPQLAIVLAGD